MRTQRRAANTVRLVRISRTGDNGLGDFTGAESSVSVNGAIFEPARIDERTGEAQAHVLQPASWNVPGCHRLGANDEVRCGDDVWYVVGGSTVWLDRTNIPVSRTRTS